MMIGEIRDAETAAIACRGALIGRLVPSTLHVNDPSEAPIRLKDLGVEPCIIGAVLLGALGQTLRPVIRGGLPRERLLGVRWCRRHRARTAREVRDG